ncbi:AAA family ATPase [Alphaproteobacteria bacterium endosymbiont of Tiliacea citrago]|uniref:AAA family ATPase n=1 Tax=Alphaproteobacteria bacterium endosymbiont of Tiliacea citrago TaxID=3077944 RepID=UPI00313EC551
MKHKSLLILASIFDMRSEPSKSDVDSLKNQAESMKSADLSLGRAEVGYKGLFLPYSIFVFGVDATLNVYLGAGAIYNTEYQGWPLEFRAILYYFDWENKEFSREYFSKVPVSLSVATNILGFNVGASVALSLNKKFLVSVFVNIVHDDFDLSINYHAYGKNDFFSKSSFSKVSLKKWREDNKKVVSGFKTYCLKNNAPNEQQEKMIKAFLDHCSYNVALADYYIDDKKISDYSKGKSDSIFIIGRSGSGKTYIYDLIEKFIEENELNSIALFKLSADNFTPEGYVGGKANKQVENGYNTIIEDNKFKHNLITLSRCLILIDEIDCISDKGIRGGADDFYTRVQKNLLEFIEGKKFYQTKIGKIRVNGCFKLLPGAYESRSGELERKVIENVLLSNTMLGDLIKPLNNYIKKEKIVGFNPEIYELFNKLKTKTKDFSERVTTILKKNPIFNELLSNDHNPKSVEEIIAGLEKEKVFSDFSTDNKVLALSKEISGSFKKLEDSIKTEAFYDVYSRVIKYGKELEFLADKPEGFVRIVELAIENYKLSHPLYCLQESGMGKEMLRRGTKYFYIMNPSVGVAKKFLQNSKLGELLNNLEKNEKIKIRGCSIDDYYYQILDYKKNDNATFTYRELSNISSDVIEEIKQVLSSNGKIALVKENGIILIKPEVSEIEINELREFYKKEKKKLEESIVNLSSKLESGIKTLDLSISDENNNALDINTELFKEDDKGILSFPDNIDLTKLKKCFSDFSNLQNKNNRFFAIQSMIDRIRSMHIDGKHTFHAIDFEKEVRQNISEASSLFTNPFVYKSGWTYEELQQGLKEYFHKHNIKYITADIKEAFENLIKNIEKRNNLISKDVELKNLEVESANPLTKTPKTKEAIELQKKTSKLQEEISKIIYSENPESKIIYSENPEEEASKEGVDTQASNVSE